jgi:hypothetical protein
MQCMKLVRGGLVGTGDDLGHVELATDRSRGIVKGHLIPAFISSDIIGKAVVKLPC